MPDEIIKPTGAPKGTPTETPNKDVPQDKSGDEWKNDPRLDENGNLKEVTPEKAKEPAKEPVEDDKKPEGAEEPEGKKEGENKKDDKAFDFSAPIVKQIETLVTDSGLVASDVAKAVTENGGKLPPAMAKALSDKHGDLVATLIADKLETFHVGANEQKKAKEQKVFTKLEEAFKGVTDQSGEKTWSELKTWAKDNVPAAERKEINALLAQGGYAAELALDTLVSKFKNTSVVSQEPELEGGSVVAQIGIKPLSKAEYLREFEALEAKGLVYGESREFNKLDAQRLAGRQRGI